MNRIVVIAGVVALAALAAFPAHAASAAPDASTPRPTSVHVSGTSSLDATVTWSAPAPSWNRITGYTVTITPAEQQPDHGVDTLPASARSDRFGDLTAGTTYRFAVRAVSRRGLGAPVTVSYTAPEPVVPKQFVYALTAAGAVERFPVAGGAGEIVVPSGGAGYAVDDLGDVLVPATGGTSIVLYPVDGGAPRTVATGLSITGALQIDVPGDVFFQSGSSIVELPVTGAAQHIVGPFTSTNGWVVASDGTVSTIAEAPAPGPGPFTPYSQVISYPPTGGSVTRTTDFVEYPQAFLADGHGNLFVENFVAGGSGALPWLELPAGSSTLVSAEPAIGFDAVAVNADRFQLIQGATWCNATSEQFGTCKPPADRTAHTLRSTNTTTNAVTTTAISGLTLGAPLSRTATVGAADRAGDVFVDIATGPTSGLYRVPVAGGAVTRIDAGQFSRILVN